MSIDALVFEGKDIILEASVNGTHLVPVRLRGRILDRDLLIDAIDPLKVSARAKLVGQLPSELQPEGDDLLMQLAGAVLDQRQLGDHTSQPEQPSRWSPVEPWATPVEGLALMNLLSQTLRRFLVLPTGAAYDAMALWVVFAHAYDCFDFNPLLVITSAERGCGKTRLLEVLEALTPRPWTVLSPSDAALYRVIDKHRPTLLLDEADNVQWKDRSQLIALLNGGFSRGGTIPRCVGEGASLDVKDFSVWCPKAFASIRLANLPDTTLSRSIVLRLERKLRTESVERFRGARTKAELGVLGRQVSRWVDDHAGELREAEPDVPEVLSDRAADAWMPVFAIAGTLAGPWPERARAAALKLCGENDYLSEGTALLRDIRGLFDQDNVPVLFTKELIRRLNQLDDAPWSEWNRKGLTPRSLATLLEPFGIGPRTHRIGLVTAKGYGREQFELPWARYLLPIPTPVTSHGQPTVTGREGAESALLCDGSQNDAKSPPDIGCDGVAADTQPIPSWERGDAWEPAFGSVSEPAGRPGDL